MNNMPTPGQYISLFISGAVAHSCVAVQILHGTVRRETTKALQIEALDEDGTYTERLCWLPKKAIKIDQTDGQLSLAHWFKPEGYTRWFLAHMARVSGVSA